MRHLLALLLLAGTMAGAQQIYVQQSVPDPVCGKYQHLEPTGIVGWVSCRHGEKCVAYPDNRCVDDMHTVTEREWQELMERLKAPKKEPKP